MTDPHPVSSTSARKRPSESSAPSHDGFVVPAPPGPSAKHHAGTAVVPSGPPSAPKSEIRKGHSTSNTSPPSPCTIPSSKVSESQQALAPRIKRELRNNVFEVETDAFLRVFLYNGAETKMQEDANLAAECLATLKLQQPTIPPPTASHSTGSTPASLPRPPDAAAYSKKSFTKLKQSSNMSEDEMYDPYVSLLDYVGSVFRSRSKDVDDTWLVAQQPTAGTPSQNTGRSLQRVFRVTHNQPRSFSRYKEGQAGLKPDLCLLIEPKECEGEPMECENEPMQPTDELMGSEDDDDLMTSEDEGSEYEPEKPKGQSKQPKGKPKLPPHWKDVGVAMEIKLNELIDSDALAQVAQYARCMLMEQFDRRFVFTVLFNGGLCRVFHWDIVGAHVTAPFSIHKQPELFLQVMGRFATMTPSELGYDLHFSNAGRVLSTEIDDIKTHLTIHPSRTRPFINHNPKLPTRQCQDDPHTLVFELTKMQFESKGLLFNRATRVWTARALNDPPEHEQSPRSEESEKDTYIIKQNWADDRRPNEGFFHKVAQEVEAVPRLEAMEQRDLTSTFRDQLSESEGSKLPSLMDIPDEKNANHAGGHSFQRVLLRFVFKGKGRSLNQAENSAELLQAAVQWIDGLIDLDEKGIIHRDISYGNLLLPSESGGAKIIDLGLSHLKNAAKSIKEFASDDDENYDEAISGCPHAHHHITGTLPFVAHDLLYALWRAQSCEHTLYHDVESIFWVLLYVCLKEHGGPMAGIWTDVLSSLTSSEIGAVVTQKNMCLTKEGFYNNIGGKFGDLEGFFSGYYDIYRWHGKEVAKDTATRVRNLALSELQKILASQVTNEQKIHPS